MDRSVTQRIPPDIQTCVIPLYPSQVQLHQRGYIRDSIVGKRQVCELYEL